MYPTTSTTCIHIKISVDVLSWMAAKLAHVTSPPLMAFSVYSGRKFSSISDVSLKTRVLKCSSNVSFNNIATKSMPLKNASVVEAPHKAESNIPKNFTWSVKWARMSVLAHFNVMTTNCCSCCRSVALVQATLSVQMSLCFFPSLNRWFRWSVTPLVWCPTCCHMAQN